MPQLIIVALVGGAIWYGYRTFKREMDRVAQETREAELKRQPATRLEKDKDGVYRPAEDGGNQS